MKKGYIFSNAIGTFLFDENYREVKKKEITEKELEDIENGKWIKQEKELIKLFSKKKLYYIGYKAEKLENIIITQEEEI